MIKIIKKLILNQTKIETDFLIIKKFFKTLKKVRRI